MRDKLYNRGGAIMLSAAVFIFTLTIGTWVWLMLGLQPQSWGIQMVIAAGLNTGLMGALSSINGYTRRTIGILTRLAIVALGTFVGVVVWAYALRVGLGLIWAQTVAFTASFLVVSTTASMKALEGIEKLGSPQDLNQKRQVNRGIQAISVAICAAAAVGGAGLIVMEGFGLSQFGYVNVFVNGVAINTAVTLLINRMFSKNRLVVDVLFGLWVSALISAISCAVWFTLTLIGIPELISLIPTYIAGAFVVSATALMRSWKGWQELKGEQKR